MVRVGFPRWPIATICLITPNGPAITCPPRKQLKIRTAATRLDNRVLFVRLTRMLALARRDKVYLPAPRRKRSRVLTTHTEQDELSDVTEVKSNAASIRTAVFAHLVPDNIALVVETPRFHDRETLGQERVRTPKI